MKEKQVILPNILDGEDKSSPLKNRIRKNFKHIRKWAKRTLTNCFRIYDREIKEYPLAIDYYDHHFCIHYFASLREDQELPLELQKEVEQILCSLFATDPKAIYWRTRKKRQKTEQYEKVNHLKKFLTVIEYGVKFKVNLLDYLDTGLFLDHRETRQFVASVAKDKRLLNLFAYTCSFSVQAAVAGATFTKSVDLSNTYTDWGKENFALNKISLKNHQIIRADYLKFLEKEIHSNIKYDIIVIDPPTISRSKKMEEIFDIQIKYIPLLSQALQLLEENGIIIFSTNSRKFKFDESQFPFCEILDISKKTIPLDFHDVKIHRTWKISHR